MNGTVQTDPLFIGLTRPPMLFGVSYMFFVLNAFTGMVAYIATSNFRYLLSIFFMHALGYYLCSKEPLFIELWKTRIEKCSRSKNKLYHGANSYDCY